MDAIMDAMVFDIIEINKSHAIRKMRSVVVAGISLMLVWCVFSTLATPSRAQGAGAFHGTVTIAGTEEPAPGVTVFLEHYRGEEMIQTLTAETDAEGRFEFAGLETAEGNRYIAQVTYGGVDYTSRPMAFEPTQDLLTSAFVVYEATSDDSDIELERVHLIIRILPEGVQVGQMAQISNLGDKVYVGQEDAAGRRPTLRFPLPPNAANIEFEDGILGERFLEMDGGVADTWSVLPGRSVGQVVFSYLLPASGEAWNLDYQFAYPVRAINVLVAADGWEMSSDRLVFSGTMGGEMAFRNYAGTDIAAGETIRMEFVPGRVAPMHQEARSVQPTLQWLAAGLGAIMLLFLTGYPRWRGKLLR